jgi:hypothetical protein
MSLVVTSMSGCAKKWWRWWSPRHPAVSWETFTNSFLWRFKPEYCSILPLFDEEEETDQELWPLSELNMVVSKSCCTSFSIYVWDTFLLSTKQTQVPHVLVTNLMVVTIINSNKWIYWIGPSDKDFGSLKHMVRNLIDHLCVWKKFDWKKRITLYTPHILWRKLIIFNSSGNFVPLTR